MFKCSRPWIRRLIKRLNLRISVATKEAHKLPTGWKAMVRLSLLQLAHTTPATCCECRPDWYHAGTNGEENICMLERKGYSVVGY